MGDKSEVAYCGLFCGDCVIRKGRLAASARELLGSMRSPEFQKLADGLAGLRPDPFAALKDHRACCRVLDAMLHLDCAKACKQGGGSAECRIRECCRDKAVEGCWMCDDFESCEVLAWLDPVHGDAHRENIRRIREEGLEEFLNGDKQW